MFLAYVFHGDHLASLGLIAVERHFVEAVLVEEDGHVVSGGEEALPFFKGLGLGEIEGLVILLAQEVLKICDLVLRHTRNLNDLMGAGVKIIAGDFRLFAGREPDGDNGQCDKE